MASRSQRSWYTRAVPNRPLIAVLGPTAVGKSSLGVALARRFGGVILSADARQVYRGLDAGTAKISPSEMRGVPHFLLDLASPRRTLTVAQFQRAAQRVLRRIPAHQPVFIVGGSPFYLDAILNPSPFPDVPPNPKLRARLERRTTRQLMAMLCRRDQRRAATIDPHNRHRLIRALEIVAALGRVPARPPPSPTATLKLGLALPRPVLYRRIDRRVDARVPAMVHEMQRLHRSGLSWRRLDELGLEYRWISRAVRGQLPLADAVARLKGDIHAFARRQLTWWRRDPDIRWMTTQSQARRLTRGFLERREGRPTQQT